MACETRFTNVAPVVRKSQIKAALERLENFLQTGRASLIIGPQGALAIKGWEGQDRDGVMDACAIRKLLSSNSWPLRQAIARAEAQQGRKADMRAVAAGVHSHDGGITFHPGHKK